MTNIITNIVAALSIFVTTKTNQIQNGSYSDGPMCEICHTIHHSIHVGTASIVQQRWLVGKVNGIDINFLVDEVVIGQNITTNTGPVIKFSTPYTFPVYTFPTNYPYLN